MTAGPTTPSLSNSDTLRPWIPFHLHQTTNHSPLASLISLRAQHYYSEAIRWRAIGRQKISTRHIVKTHTLYAITFLLLQWAALCWRLLPSIVAFVLCSVELRYSSMKASTSIYAQQKIGIRRPSSFLVASMHQSLAGPFLSSSLSSSISMFKALLMRSGRLDHLIRIRPYLLFFFSVPARRYS